VLTIVGAFFVAPKTVSVLGRNHCPETARISIRIGQARVYLENRSSENCINQTRQKAGIKISCLMVTLLNHVIMRRKKKFTIEKN